MAYTRSNKKTKRTKRTTRNKTRSHRKGSKKTTRSRTPKWITALAAAQTSLRTTGSVKIARAALRQQALINAKKLFGAH